MMNMAQILLASPGLQSTTGISKQKIISYYTIISNAGQQQNHWNFCVTKKHCYNNQLEVKLVFQTAEKNDTSSFDSHTNCYTHTIIINVQSFPHTWSAPAAVVMKDTCELDR